MSAWLAQLNEAGYVMCPAVFSVSEVAAALAACSTMLTCEAAADSILANETGAAYGARNVLRLWPNVLDMLQNAAFAKAVLQTLGPKCGAVRGLYFDKPPGHSWALPWHRDKTIAVKQHGPIGAFKKPTAKAGVPHVEAPANILNTMLTARIHLDEVTAGNGPLRVIPGSHVHNSDEKSPPDQTAVTLHCSSGDVLLMRPLLLHSSGHSEPGNDKHRRILHLEFAPSPTLPAHYEWHDFVAMEKAQHVLPCPEILWLSG